MFPEFENEFLSELVGSLKKRRKSLKHRVRFIKCDKVYELDEDDNRTEKLELVLIQSSSSKGMQCRLFAWPDRSIWVDARKAAKKGWEWQWTFEGRLLGEFTSSDLISTLETALFDTLDSELSPMMPKITEVWRPLLAKGPIRVN